MAPRPNQHSFSYSSTSSVNPFAGQNIGYLRLAVVGDSGVGKTSFARQFTETLPEVLSHDWEPLDANEDDYKRTDVLIEKFSSTMMEIPWDNMDADDEVPAKNLVFVGKSCFVCFFFPLLRMSPRSYFYRCCPREKQLWTNDGTKKERGMKVYSPPFTNDSFFFH